MYSHLERTIPHNTIEGNEYLIKFEIFPSEQLPIMVNLPVISLTLVQVTSKGKNSRRFFNFLAQYIADYVIEFNVILYYYCDQAEIDMRGSRDYTPQKYRHEVFEFAYNTIPSGTLARLPIIIKDEAFGDHYMTLVSSKENEEILNKLAETFLEEYKK